MRKLLFLYNFIYKNILLTLNFKKMNGLFDIKSPNWLGGVNVHNTIALLGIGFLVYKAVKK
jgi:hypothetical protein